MRGSPVSHLLRCIESPGRLYWYSLDGPDFPTKRTGRIRVAHRSKLPRKCLTRRRGEHGEITIAGNLQFQPSFASPRDNSHEWAIGANQPPPGCSRIRLLVNENWQRNDKPGSVVGVHLSGMPITRHLKQPTRKYDEPDRFVTARRQSFLLFGLAPDGVYPAGSVTRTAGALLPHRFTLTS
jgi:hypothetical protein